MIGTIYFIYGLVFGSFYNVVIYRIPNELKVSDGNSRCTHCNTRIKAKYLVPVFSWLFLRGKSACCGHEISPIYPTVELLTGFAFLVAYLFYGASLESIYCIGLFSCLIIVGIIDLQHKAIYDKVLLSFFISAIIIQAVAFVGKIDFSFTLRDSLIGATLSYCFYFLIYYVSKKIYKREAFGLGDVLYITVIGFYLGIENIFFLLFGPFYVALFFFLIMKIFSKSSLNLKSEIPFGPFISISTFLLTIYNGMF